MYKKVTKEMVLILVMAAFLAVPSSMLQVSHAQSNSNLQDTALNMHNQERGTVGVPPLTWSSSLATEAQGYANQLASQGHVCNAQQCDMLPHGANNENLAWGSVGFPVVDMIQGWIDEKSSYDGGPVPSGGGPAGHYTAMVWGSTSEVGCGTATGAQIDILVCRYNPPGNMEGQTPFGQGAAQAVGEGEAAAPLQEEGAAAPLDDQGAAPDDGGGDDGGGDDGGGDDGGGDDGGGDDGN